MFGACWPQVCPMLAPWTLLSGSPKSSAFPGLTWCMRSLPLTSSPSKHPEAVTSRRERLAGCRSTNVYYRYETIFKKKHVLLPLYYVQKQFVWLWCKWGNKMHFISWYIHSNGWLLLKESQARYGIAMQGIYTDCLNVDTHLSSKTY